MSENEYCDTLFRYRLSDEDGALRFTDFELLGALRNSRLQKVLVPYLEGRELASVRPEDLPGACCPEEGVCLNTIIQHLQELQTMVGK